VSNGNFILLKIDFLGKLKILISLKSGKQLPKIIFLQKCAPVILFILNTEFDLPHIPPQDI
jgi:hypothetical protein